MLCTGLPPSVVGQRFMLAALKPRLPGNWKHHHPGTSLTTLVTTNTIATASCSSILHPLVISFLIDIDINLPLDVCDRSMLVASTTVANIPLPLPLTLVMFARLLPPLLSFIFILNYKPCLMPPTNVNGLMLATSHLHLPIYFLQLLQFLMKL
jgi:hypothetical protein